MDFEVAVECVEKSPNVEVPQTPGRCSKTSSKEEECTASGVSSSGEDVTWRKKRNSRKNILSNLEKRILIREIKDHPCIWDESDDNHADIAAVENAWIAVSAAVGKPIPNCKTTWAFLEEAKRYQMAQEKEAETEDGGGETTSSEMLEHSYFLTEASKKRRIMEYPLVPNERELVDEDSESRSSGNISNYSYASSSSKEDEEQTSISRMVTGLEKLVDLQCSKLRPPAPPLVHYAMLANIDRLLQKLPPLEVHRVNLEMQRIVLEQISKSAK